MDFSMQYTTLLDRKKLPGLLSYVSDNDYYILRVEQKNGKPFYTYTKEIREFDYKKYIVHEVINGTKPFRIFFDIDARNIKNKSVIKKTIVSTINKMFNGAPMVVSNNNTSPTELGMHIILYNNCVNNCVEMKQHNYKLVQQLGKYGKYVDKDLPKRRFNLRVLGSTKDYTLSTRKTGRGEASSYIIQPLTIEYTEHINNNVSN